MKTCIFNQFRGLGDIFFIIPICKHYVNLGYKVVIPVDSQFVEIQKNFPELTIVDKNSVNINYENRDFYEDDEKLIIPIRWANNILNNGDVINVMHDKYRLVNLPFEMWRTLSWKRDVEAEQKLFNLLGLKEGEKYNLINNFATSRVVSNINVENDNKNIYMFISDEFNILDWTKVIEQATEIHTVCTSLVILIEVLKCGDLHLWPGGGPFLSNVYNKKYTIHKD
jgi:hypothetical protein